MDILEVLPDTWDWSLMDCSPLALSVLRSSQMRTLLNNSLNYMANTDYLDPDRRMELSMILELYLALHRPGPSLSSDVISEASSLGNKLLSNASSTKILIFRRDRIVHFLREAETRLLQVTSPSVDEVTAVLRAMGITDDDLPFKLARTRHDAVWDHALTQEDAFLSFLLSCGASNVEADLEQKLYLVQVLPGRSILDEIEEKWSVISPLLPDMSVSEAKQLVLVEEENSGEDE